MDGSVGWSNALNKHLSLDSPFHRYIAKGMIDPPQPMDPSLIIITTLHHVFTCGPGLHCTLYTLDSRLYTLDSRLYDYDCIHCTIVQSTSCNVMY